MDSLLEAIRAAVVQDASEEVRAAGASACRTILTAIAATPGEPMVATVVPPPTPIATAISALRGMPADQLLDLAIARLRAALPADAVVPPVQPLRFQMIPIATLAGKAP